MGNIANQAIGQKIYFIRSQRVMLDSDLAALYEVETKALNRAVRRNIDRFPSDFMFQLSTAEHDSLRRQIGTLEKSRGKHRKYAPLVFTEQGVAMLSSVLKSHRAVQVNIEIMRAFVRVRELMVGNKELSKKLAELEKKSETHDAQFKAVFEAIRQLINPALSVNRRKVGFKW